jgi:sugar phosphate isomerase/epimerase
MFIDFREKEPLAAKETMYQDAKGDVIPDASVPDVPGFARHAHNPKLTAHPGSRLPIVQSVFRTHPLSKTALIPLVSDETIGRAFEENSPSMLPVLSTHLFLKQRLHPGILETAARCGAQGIELFAARQHFDYTSREHVSELAAWFASNPLQPWSMHAPLWPDREMGRAGAPAVNLVHTEKSRRIDAMDEIKRALEVAEHIPIQKLIVHLGENFDSFSMHLLEFATTALEHLGAFAKPLGVRVLVENLTSDATTPEHLMTILDMAHLDQIDVCLDLGHAHIGPGIAEAIGIFGKRITELHIHDNHGLRDEHLWPGNGTIDWVATLDALKSLPTPPAAVLEIGYNLEDAPASIPDRIQRAFEKIA